MLKTILVLVIFLSAMTIISALIPQQLTDKMDSAIVYFLGQINNLRTFSDTIVSNFFDILHVFGYYLLFVVIFFGVRWILNLIS